MTDSTTGDLERRVARAIDPAPWIALDNKSPDIVNSPQRRMASLSKARAALKAHAEWLESEGLEIVCTGRPHSRKPTIEELEKILEGPGGNVRIKPSGEVVVEAAKQEDQHND